VTDRRTDGRTDSQTEFSLLDRVWIACSAVKSLDLLKDCLKVIKHSRSTEVAVGLQTITKKSFWRWV